jgi:hypothetical protein
MTTRLRPTSRLAFVAILTSIALPACGGDMVPVGGHDAGRSGDAGAPNDASAPADAGAPRDGGPRPDDASAVSDGGPPVGDGAIPHYDGAIPHYDGSIPFYDGSIPFYDGSIPFYDGSIPFYDGGGAPTFCGGFIGAACAPDAFCDYDEVFSSACGGADGSGVCRPRPTECTDIGGSVCACDGHTYSNECYAQMAGFDIWSVGACDGGGGAECSPDDVTVSGPCDAFFGYAWNGFECYSLSGCSCTGDVCGRHATRDACEEAHAACFSVAPPGEDPGEPGDPGVPGR